MKTRDLLVSHFERRTTGVRGETTTEGGTKTLQCEFRGSEERKTGITLTTGYKTVVREIENQHSQEDLLEQQGRDTHRVFRERGREQGKTGVQR